MALGKAIQKKNNLNEEKIFKEGIEKIKGANIDLAFFPVDPRLGRPFIMVENILLKN